MARKYKSNKFRKIFIIEILSTVHGKVFQIGRASTRGGAKQISFKNAYFVHDLCFVCYKFRLTAFGVICDEILKFHRKFSTPRAYFLKSSETFGACFSCSLAAKNSALTKLKTLAMMLVGNISQALL